MIETVQGEKNATSMDSKNPDFSTKSIEEEEKKSSEDKMLAGEKENKSKPVMGTDPTDFEPSSNLDNGKEASVQVPGEGTKEETAPMDASDQQVAPTKGDEANDVKAAVATEPAAAEVSSGELAETPSPVPQSAGDVEESDEGMLACENNGLQVVLDRDIDEEPTSAKAETTADASVETSTCQVPPITSKENESYKDQQAVDTYPPGDEIEKATGGAISLANVQGLPPSNTQAEEEARLQVEQDKRSKAEEEARLLADQEQNRLLEEADAMKKAEEEARMKADQETSRIEAEVLAKEKAEEEARMKAEHEKDRLAVEKEAQKMAEDEARMLATQIEGAGKSIQPLLSDDSPESITQETQAVLPMERSCEQESLPMETNGPKRASQEDHLVQPSTESSSLPNTPDRDEKVSTTTEKIGCLASDFQEEVDNLCNIAFPTDINDVPQLKHEFESESSAVSPEDMTVAFIPVDESNRYSVVTALPSIASVSEEPDSISESPKMQQPICNTPQTRESAFSPASAFVEKTPRPENDSPKSRTSGVSFAEAFGGETPKPKSDTPITQSSGTSFAEAFGGETPKSTITTPSSRTSGLSFAEAFADDLPKAIPATPRTDTSESNGLRLKPSPLQGDSEHKGETSLTAFGAAKNRRVSGLMSKYLEKVTKEPLPGDSIKIESSVKDNVPNSPIPSPVKPSSSKSLKLETKELRKIDSLREKFENSARSSKSNVFEFGEAFRQKQRFSLLAERERKKEAIVNIHGFDEMMVVGRTKAGGEIDTSNLKKTYTFEIMQGEDGTIDGACKVDYQNNEYHGMIFVVHRTRGMLLLNYLSGEDIGETRIPGGKIFEEEFVAAAKKSGDAGIQLQTAAQMAAARSLYEGTGIDIRKKLDRLTPAVLRLSSTADAKGAVYLKNENENRLYYFLQVSEDDFVRGGNGETDGLFEPKGESGTGLYLKLAQGFSDFTFIGDPADATFEFEQNGDQGAMKALSMIMHQSENHEDPTKSTAYVKDKPLEMSRVGEKAADGDGMDWEGRVITVGGIDQSEEGQAQDDDPGPFDVHGPLDENTKLATNPSMDSAAAQQEVTCCCGFWR